MLDIRSNPRLKKNSGEDNDKQNHELISLIKEARKDKRVNSFWKLRRVFMILYLHKLTKARDIFPKYLGYIATFSIFFFSISPSLLRYFFDKWGTSGKVNLLIDLCNAIVGVSSSLLAAVFIDISFRLRDEYQKITHALKLKNLLSCDVKSKSVVLVLPKYPMAINKVGVQGYIKEVYRNAIDYELLNQNEEYIDEDMHYFSTLAYQDVVASSNIIAMFEKGELPRPIIKTDVEILSNLVDLETHKLKSFPKNGEIKTYICVGLFSNEISMWINNHVKESNANGKFFKFRKVITDQNFEVENLGRINLAAYKDAHIDYNKWPNDSNFLFKGHSESKTEFTSYALFSKVIIEDISFIIIGGLTAKSTLQIGKFLKYNWESVCEYEDSITNTHIGDNPFSIVYRLTEDQEISEDDKTIRIDKLKREDKSSNNK